MLNDIQRDIFGGIFSGGIFSEMILSEYHVWDIPTFFWGGRDSVKNVKNKIYIYFLSIVAFSFNIGMQGA